MDDLLTDFLTETNESLAEADLALVRLEQEPEDAATLSLIFRLVHTIKGTCGFLGLPRLEHVAHAAENVLGRVRDGVLPVTPDLITAILVSLDRIKLIVAGLASNGVEPAGSDTELIGDLEAISLGQAPPTHVSEPVETVAVAPPSAAPPPPVEQPPPALTEPVLADGTNAEQPLSGQTIRVGVDVIENLMTLVSELVLTRNQLLQQARSHENSGFTGPLQRLSHITSDLQEGVMKTRMQPIGNAWNKLPRIVRDLARELGKKIDLVMLGAETELDRQVLELIKDPLTHMVRNSGDHGLETTAERRAAGKVETGRITLNAFHEGGHIVIEIADDGRGLPIDRIKAKVISKGLATEVELAAMSDEAVQRFIFRAGFSTAAAVTAVSGRGVGMDVVKTNIERIGGTIELKSRPGDGTVFTIKIPLTLAIVSALIVQAGEERFAIPQISVVELVRAREGGGKGPSGDSETITSVVERISGTPVLRLRERLLPLVSLDELLRLREPAHQHTRTVQLAARSDAQDGMLTIIVAQVGASQLGLIVDRVFDTEEIVVKPVAPVLRHISMFSGNTILGDGSVIMILDPSGIARASGVAGASDGRSRSNSAAASVVTQVQPDKTAMLLFRVGADDIKAVPLGLVARLENIPQDRIECAAGLPVTQYRGRLMRLVPMSGHLDTERRHQSVLVFTDSHAGYGGDRRMGLLVDEIVDVVEENLHIELCDGRDGVLGTAIIAGRATDVIDTSFWLTQAQPDWFDTVAESASGGSAQRVRLLVVEDSDFFRQMIVPVLQAAGYEVSSVPDAAKALALREGGAMFDAIISDIEMPGMDGLGFVRAVRAGGAWSELPVIALSGRAAERDIERGREAGFTDDVGKFAKEALLLSLRQCLSHTLEASHHALRMVA
jgi:two-component system chemotaxis sensor kinase CheA